MEANKDFDKLAKGLIDGKLNMQIDVNKIIDKDVLFHVESKVDREIERFKNIINTHVKRLSIINRN